MRILIGQPVHEQGISQLERDIRDNKNIDMVLYPEGYLSDTSNLRDACKLAKENSVAIITSYRKDKKDVGVIIGSNGERIYERQKTSPEEAEKLNMPLSVNYHGITIGYVLCMEILKGVRDIKNAGTKMDFIAHPIGVGMFSEEQFQLWIGEAEKIAATYETIIFGTSHADGSYRNCGVSIPISYCISRDGVPLYISKSDTRKRIVDLETGEVEILGK